MPTLDIEGIFVWLSFCMYILHLVSSQLLKVVLYTSGKICSARLIFLFFWQCVWIYPLINIKILTNSNQQTQSYQFTSHIAAFLSVGLITEMLEICLQTSHDQNIQLILKSYLPVVYDTALSSS